MLTDLLAAGAARAQHAYITNASSDSRLVIDTRTNTIVGSPMRSATAPKGVAVRPDGIQGLLVAHHRGLSRLRSAVIATRVNPNAGAWCTSATADRRSGTRRIASVTVSCTPDGAADITVRMSRSTGGSQGNAGSYLSGTGVSDGRFIAHSPPPTSLR